MGCLLYLFLCLILSITCVRFLVTAPSVFHVGVKEQVSVQVCASLMNSPVTCLLEQEVGSVNAKKAAELLSANGEPPYLNLVCNIGGIKRKQTRVLISQHRGYIFIQTDQPVYNPTQKGKKSINSKCTNIHIYAKHVYINNSSNLFPRNPTISGGFHCRFGVKEETDIKFIKGLEITGPVSVFCNYVMCLLGGEVQESEIFLPIVSQRYKVDLSRTRSHYTPNMPFDLVVNALTPNGPPAAHVQVSIDVPVATEKSKTQHTNEEGMTIFTVNLEAILPVISFEVSRIGLDPLTKEVSRVTSLRNSFLYISVTNKVVLPGHSLNVAFNILNGNPEDGRIYYMVLNKGILKKTSSLIAADLTKISLAVSSDMTPSFRLIGYYYDTNGEIIADSVWVDVKDVCEGKVNHNFASTLHDARVALLAVDKAIYALNAQNKLTPKQVFSSMQSYDLGCSYGGGTDTAAVFNGAGLAFISHSQTVRSQMRRGFGCESGFRRQRRSIDLHKQMAEKESMYKNTTLKKCCRHGLTLIPMRLTCEERKKRIVRTESAACVEAFMKCCQFATQLREKKRQEDIRSGHGRSTNIDYIEDFFENDVDHIRRSFPPSFEFRDFKVNGKTTYKIYAPDSITTWEVQAVSLSSSHGFCVAKPVDIRVFKELFVSLRLPYSVKRNEQLALLVVIYNYGTHERQLAVHMKQVDGLCSPGASSTASYTNVNLGPQSSETVTFSAVPLIDGEIPITIVLYDREMEMGVDAIQRTLLVMTEGVRMQEEKSFMINLDGRSSKYIHIDGMFPNSTVPETDTNVFVKIEGVDGIPPVSLPLLSPSSVERLIRAPIGCAEQTMIRMSPTALSIRFLDSSSHWLELAAGSRDTALDHLEKGYERILTFKKPDGSYGAWQGHPTSNWLTALVVKVLSLASNLVTTANQRIISQVDIQDAAMYLIKKQNDDGSFTDPNPVIHREMQGGIGGMEQDASLTAFVTVALNHSLPFLGQNTQPEDSISRATDYLLLRIGELERPYAVAITAYCLSTCLKNHALALSAWMKLKSLAVVGNESHTSKAHLVPPAMALTVETTAYALLTALAQGDLEEAKAAACFLSTQENYEGGFRSTQDTIMALEALSVYTVQKPASAFDGISAQFTSPLRNTMEKVVLNKKDEKVEAELKRLLGGDITAKLSGNGDVKIKVAKAYYALDPYNACDHISIDVTVKGKVEYTAQVMANYNYYGNGDYEDGEMEEGDFPRSAIEWFDARSRRRRDTEGSSEDTVVYEVCVSHSLERNISGMAVADITLLSGFEPIVEELDKLKDLSDKYISHYEVSKGRVLLYFNEILDGRECITFEAKQTVPIGLVQPAPATFYDYYEPDRRCSVFYSAPKRSKMVSVLCSEDVCQCAERPCFKEKKSLESLIQKGDRFKFACYYPVVDYGFVVTVLSVDEASNFQLFSTNVTEVLKNSEDTTVDVGDIRVFAKRKHCKGQLETGKTYLIMGNDGSTTDSRGQMQYLLDSNTWVEQKFDAKVCRASVNRKFCKELKDFLREYQINGCSQ
uniref:Complement 4B (Chido blood group) n=1 Tax=Electrophorus electricus TaxID=8005 RepID=A0AAY5E855_ELEEL